ncbi:major facilitator superfamily domain-containing protein [Bipolaris maydis]|nr:major facilitator superfamily domain-containing protein [Bipolaris maydis]
MAALIQLNAIRAKTKEQLRTLNLTSTPPPIQPHLSPYEPPFERDPKAFPQDEESHDPDDANTPPYTSLPGISLQATNSGSHFYLVSWDSASDPTNPRNWSLSKRLKVLFLLDLVAAVVTTASSIEAPVAPQSAAFFHASESVHAFCSTGIYLMGFGLGSLVAAPASEMLGRYQVYLYSLVTCECWLVGAALAPNLASLAIFRFLAGCFASAPMTVAGGSMSDLWSAREMTWTLPVFGAVCFGGPVLGPLIASYIGESEVVSWRWAEWIIVVLNAVCLLVVAVAMEETYPPQLLKLKAKQLRKFTGERRFKTAEENEHEGLGSKLKKNFTRPFRLALEPIVVLLTFYNTLVYVVLFTFLVGYPYTFQKIYGMSQGLKNLCFLGLLVGIMLSAALIPFVWTKTEQLCREKGDDGSGKSIPQESRLMFAMFGAPCLPIGLFWMGWTSYESISVWSPLAASVVIGFGTVCIFMSTYLYIIDSYQMYAASALSFQSTVRYVIASAMTIGGTTMYRDIGTQWTLTLLGCIAIIVTPAPYALYRYGPIIRGKSKFAVR